MKKVIIFVTVLMTVAVAFAELSGAKMKEVKGNINQMSAEQRAEVQEYLNETSKYAQYDDQYEYWAIGEGHHSQVQKARENAERRAQYVLSRKYGDIPLTVHQTLYVKEHCGDYKNAKNIWQIEVVVVGKKGSGS